MNKLKNYTVKWKVNLSGKDFTGVNNFNSIDTEGAIEKTKSVVSRRIGKSKDYVEILNIEENEMK